jgi:predicted Zn-dependent protease
MYETFPSFEVEFIYLERIEQGVWIRVIVDIYASFISTKNDFLENIFRRLARTIKLQKAKIKVWQLLSESNNVWLPLPKPGKQVWQNPAKIVGF